MGEWVLMEKIFLISDLHFWHENVIKFDNRPFQSVEEMNEQLIQNWNEAVGENDIIFHLGDFCWKTGGNPAYKELLTRLNGRKRFVLGNHDVCDLNKDIKRAGKIEMMKDYEEFHYKDNIIIMSHYPIPFYKSAWSPRNYMFYGHVHTTIEDTYMNDLRKQVLTNCTESGRNRAQWLNVGCMKDYMNYRPIELDVAINLIHQINQEVKDNL